MITSRLPATPATKRSRACATSSWESSSRSRGGEHLLARRGEIVERAAHLDRRLADDARAGATSPRASAAFCSSMRAFAAEAVEDRDGELDAPRVGGEVGRAVLADGAVVGGGAERGEPLGLRGGDAVLATPGARGTAARRSARERIGDRHRGALARQRRRARGAGRANRRARAACRAAGSARGAARAASGRGRRAGR